MAYDKKGESGLKFRKKNNIYDSYCCILLILSLILNHTGLHIITQPDLKYRIKTRLLITEGIYRGSLFQSLTK